MNIYDLRKLANKEEIDYPFLLSALKRYHQPRNKIQAFLKAGDLIRIKKGLYIFGERAREVLYSKEILANLIYGPSAISLEYALSYYGFIPERVDVMTSITNNQNKHFHTPVGDFDYNFLSSKKYSFGITQIELTPTKYFLMAVKEKALADLLMLRVEKFSTEKSLHAHLVESLRIEESSLKELDYKIIAKLSSLYKNKNVTLLQHVLDSYYA